MKLSEMQKAAWENSERHGFHEGLENSNIPTKLMLIVAEAAEALEEFRSNHPSARYYNPEKPDKPEGIGPELADIVIRVGDLAEMLGFDLEDEVAVKMKYNESRPYKHGGKRV